MLLDNLQRASFPGGQQGVPGGPTQERLQRWEAVPGGFLCQEDILLLVDVWFKISVLKYILDFISFSSTDL